EEVLERPRRGALDRLGQVLGVAPLPPLDQQPPQVLLAPPLGRPPPEERPEYPMEGQELGLHLRESRLVHLAIPAGRPPGCRPVPYYITTRGCSTSRELSRHAPRLFRRQSAPWWRERRPRDAGTGDARRRRREAVGGQRRPEGRGPGGRGRVRPAHSR